MTGLNLCYAVAVLSEAVIAWLYLEYLFPRRSNLIISSCTFFVGYMALFSISLLHNPMQCVFVKQLMSQMIYDRIEVLMLPNG